MTPFEAGSGTGTEAVFGSGKEARGKRGILIVISALDENQKYEQFDADLRELKERLTDAGSRGILFRVGVLDYRVRPFAGFDRIMDEGVPFPSSFVTLLGEDLPRDFAPPGIGPIAEEPEQWEMWIEDLWVTPRRTTGTRIALHLDDSGSMTRSDFGDVPQTALDAIAARFPIIEQRIRAESDERWLAWMWKAYDEYIRDHPELP